MWLLHDTQETLRTLATRMHTDLPVNHLIERLLAPDRIIDVSLPVIMDDGSLRVFQGYRSQHSNVRWPYKWGIRFHPHVDKDEVATLSLWMSLKCAVANLPLWWGKWGVIVDPKSLSPDELERLSRAYMRAIAAYIGPDTDIPAPDVNTNSTIMWWMLDEYQQIVGHPAPGVITGKSVDMGGSLWRDEATGRGGYLALSTYLDSRQLRLQDQTICIQWFGNVGMYFARLVAEAWARVVGVSDASGALFDEQWLPIDDLIAAKTDTHISLLAYARSHGLTSGDNQDLLTHQCDILVPAALEGQITMDNVEQLHTQMILELANGPVTWAADRWLFEHNIPVLPDILANAGGVTVSYFEQLQNAQWVSWSLEQVRDKLAASMRTATETVISYAQEHSVSLRDAAMLRALDLLLQAEEARGGYTLSS